MGSIQSTYHGCSVGVRTIPVPRTQRNVRSVSYRWNDAHATAITTIVPAAYRALIGSTKVSSRSVNGPFMNHQCSE